MLNATYSIEVKVPLRSPAEKSVLELLTRVVDQVVKIVGKSNVKTSFDRDYSPEDHEINSLRTKLIWGPGRAKLLVPGPDDDPQVSAPSGSGETTERAILPPGRYPVADMLACVRQYTGLEVESLAQKLGISPSVVYRYLKGEVRPRRSNEVKILDLVGNTFGVNPLEYTVDPGSRKSAKTPAPLENSLIDAKILEPREAINILLGRCKTNYPRVARKLGMKRAQAVYAWANGRGMQSKLAEKLAKVLARELNTPVKVLLKNRVTNSSVEGQEELSFDQR